MQKAGSGSVGGVVMMVGKLHDSSEDRKIVASRASWRFYHEAPRGFQLFGLLPTCCLLLLMLIFTPCLVRTHDSLRQDNDDLWQIRSRYLAESISDSYFFGSSKVSNALTAICEGLRGRVEHSVLVVDAPDYTSGGAQSKAPLPEVPRQREKSSKSPLLEVSHQHGKLKSALLELPRQQEKLKSALLEMPHRHGKLKSALLEAPHQHEKLKSTLLEAPCHHEKLKSPLPEVPHQHGKLKSALLEAPHQCEKSKSARLEVPHQHETLKSALLEAPHQHETSKSALLEALHQHEKSKSALLEAPHQHEKPRSALLEAPCQHERLKSALLEAPCQHEKSKSALLEVPRQHEKLKTPLPDVPHQHEKSKTPLPEAPHQHEKMKTPQPEMPCQHEKPKGPLPEVPCQHEKWESRMFMQDGYSSGDEGFSESSTEESMEGSSISCTSSSSLSPFGKLSKQAHIETFPLPSTPVEKQGSLTASKLVELEPPLLQWGSHPLYTPSTNTLTISNMCNSSRLQVFEPFSTNSQFYIPGFHKSIEIPPRSAVSIPVVFLPLIEGPIEGLFVVQTNVGGFVIHVEGIGAVSPFQIKPLAAINSIPGVAMHHTISLFNPYNQPLIVEEAYAHFDECKSDTWPVHHSLKTVDRGGVFCKKNTSASVDIQSNRVAQFVTSLSSAKAQLRAVGQWVINPHCTGSILELQLSAGEVKQELVGSLYLKLSSSEVLIIPLKIIFAKLQQSSESKAHVVPEVLDFGFISKQQESEQTIVLSNPGIDPLLVERVYHSLDESIITIEIDMVLSAILYPGVKTKVASVTYVGFQEKPPPPVLFSREYDSTILDIRSKFIVKTNSSIYPLIEIPYKALVYESSNDCVSSKASSYVLFSERLGELSKELWDLYLQSESRLRNAISVPLVVFQSLLLKACHANLEVESESDIVITDPHSSGSQAIIQVAELVFPPVHVGLHEFQWLNVSNPSETPVLMQFLVSPEAVASKCRHRCLCNLANLNCNLEVEDVGSERVYPAVFTIDENGVIGTIVPPKSTVALGLIVFRPTEHCLWTSLLAVMNNLTQLEWIPLQGSGGCLGLTVLDGDVPTSALQLDFDATPFSLLMKKSITQCIFELLFFVRGDGTKSSCDKQMQKDYVVKNMGDLPLQVEVRLLNGDTSLSVDTPHVFDLKPGESTTLVVSFRPDFTVVSVEREIQLVTSLGTTLVKPLRAEFILPVCWGALLISRVEKFFWLAGLLVVMFVLTILARRLKRKRGSFLLLSSVNSKANRKGVANSSLSKFKSFDQTKVSRVENPISNGVGRMVKMGVLNTMPDYATSKKTSTSFRDQDISSEIKLKISRAEGQNTLSKSNLVHAKQSSIVLSSDNESLTGKRSGEGSNLSTKKSAIPMKVNRDCTGFPSQTNEKKEVSANERNQRKPKKKTSANEMKDKAKQKKRRSIMLGPKQEIETGFTSDSSSTVPSPNFSGSHYQHREARFFSSLSQEATIGRNPYVLCTEGCRNNSLCSTSAMIEAEPIANSSDSVTSGALPMFFSKELSVSVDKSGNSFTKAMLTSSASFPRGGQRSGWNTPPPIDGKDLADLSVPTTTSTLSPYARAPGSRLAKQTINSDRNQLDDDTVGGRVYDIWGDHFAEISRGGLSFTKKMVFAPHSQSLFARSQFLMQADNLSNSLPSSPLSGRPKFLADSSLFSSILPGTTSNR